MHHRIIEDVRKNPAISHQPPWLSAGMARPLAGDGGSSASQGRSRTNRMGFQLTEAHMLRPMISMAKKPQTSEASPRLPR
jgi:hypothetical protein